MIFSPRSIHEKDHRHTFGVTTYPLDSKYKSVECSVKLLRQNPYYKGPFINNREGLELGVIVFH